MSRSFRFTKTSLLALVRDGAKITVRDSEEKGLKFKVGIKRSVFVFEKRITGRPQSPPVNHHRRVPGDSY